MDKKPTTVIVHGRLYLQDEGALRHFEKGSFVTLTSEQAKKLGDKAKPVDLTNVKDLGGEPKPKRGRPPAQD